MIKISKKKIVSKRLLKGKFYLHSDNNGGHPSLLINKSDKKNKYKALLFTHKNSSDRTKLKHNIDEYDNKDSYIYNYPIEDKRKHFSSKELKGLRIHKDDKALISKIKRKK